MVNPIQTTQFLKRDDWTMFANINTLPQKAGVSKNEILKLVAKELTDNALDTGANVRGGIIKGCSGFYIQDDGAGIPGNDDQLAELFSINRPLISSKVIRKPSRGALGNGLRVVAGAMFSLGAKIIICTNGRTLEITPGTDGQANYKRIDGYDGTGTRIEFYYPPGVVDDYDIGRWSEVATKANRGKTYAGKTSLFWYDSDSFFALLQAAPPGVSIRQFLAEHFDGCSGRKAGNITADFYNVDACALTRDQADQILDVGRELVKPVKPSRLPTVGELDYQLAYKKTDTTIRISPARGKHGAIIPVVVEVWATREAADAALVNKTPITKSFRVAIYDKGWFIDGCGVWHSSKKNFKIRPHIWINVNTPYMPITSDGKAPDFSLIRSELVDLVESVLKAVNRKYKTPAKENRSEKEIIRANLQAAIDKASNNGALRYQERQLYYAVRPYVMDELDKELSTGNFKNILNDIESELGHDLPGIIRKNRGVFVHPFDGVRMPLGTLNVEKYRRPEYQFNKVLYIEKEGFFDLMLDAEIPQRYDLAMMTSEGYASRAARDLIDMIGDTNEPVQFFCIHDADAAGTNIYDALAYATKIRGARTVEVIDLGLGPGEALRMNLEVERFKRKRKSAVGSNYAEWETWLQENRVELNAMDSQTFIDWIESKLQQYHDGKLIPPADYLAKYAGLVLEEKLKEIIDAEVREEFDLEKIIQERYDERLPDIADQLADVDLADRIRESLQNEPAQEWRTPAQEIVAEIAHGDKT